MLNKITLKVIVLSYVLFFMLGCASGSYVEPEEIDGTAYWFNHKSRESAFKWERYIVYSVDQKPVSYSAEKMFSLSGVAGAKRRISSGIHNLVVYASFNNAAFEGGREAFINLPVKIEPNVDYVLEGRVSGGSIDVWLSNKTSGDRASEIASASHEWIIRSMSFY